MTIFHWIILAFWLVFAIYWAISAFSAKRNVRSGTWWRWLAVRLSILALVIIAAQVVAVRHGVQILHDQHTGGTLVEAIGTLLVGLGIAFAIAARVYIGRNWGMPMSRKEDPELVTGGPYAFVRHPIYTGIAFALLGSVIGYGLAWLPALLISVPYFIYSARREEALMCEQFPGQYPAYMQQTKMLVPFVL